MKGGRLKVSGYDKKWEKEVLALADGAARAAREALEKDPGALACYYLAEAMYGYISGK